MNTCLRQLLDKLAPVVTRTLTDLPSAPWMTLEIKEAKQKRRQAERQWRKSGLTIHKQLYAQHRESVKQMMQNEKKNYICSKIESSDSSIQLFRTAAELSGYDQGGSFLPDRFPTPELPEILVISLSVKLKRSVTNSMAFPIPPLLMPFQALNLISFHLSLKSMLERSFRNHPRPPVPLTLSPHPSSVSVWMSSPQ
jgi:hypothetical protein